MDRRAHPVIPGLRRPWIARLALVITAIVLLIGRDAPAAPGSKSRPKSRPKATVTLSADKAYEEAFILGRELFDQGKWAAAREQFQKAYAIQETPLLLFNIGSTYRREGKPEEALFYYRRYLAEAPPDAEYRRFAERVIVALERIIASQRIAQPRSTPTATAAQPRADSADHSVHTDPAPTAPRPPTAKPATDKGTKPPSATPVGDPTEPDRALAALSQKSRPEAKDRNKTADTAWNTSQWAGVGLVATSLVSVGWGTYAGLRAQTLASELNSLAPGTPWSNELQRKYDEGQIWATRSLVFTSVGGAVALGGIALIIWSADDTAAHAPVAIGGYADSNGLSCWVRGHF